MVPLLGVLAETLDPLGLPSPVELADGGECDGEPDDRHREQ
jgi:hypothetical protein